MPFYLSNKAALNAISKALKLLHKRSPTMHCKIFTLLCPNEIAVEASWKAKSHLPVGCFCIRNEYCDVFLLLKGTQLLKPHRVHKVVQSHTGLQFVPAPLSDSFEIFHRSGQRNSVSALGMAGRTSKAVKDGAMN